MTMATTRASSRVLVIEDEPNSREGLCTLLRDEGYVVSDASDGEEGLTKLRDFKPDAVLCDVRLPKIDGIALLRRARDIGSEAGFIMMSGSAANSGRAEALQNGAECCLRKPLNVGLVVEELE